MVNVIYEVPLAELKVDGDAWLVRARFRYFDDKAEGEDVAQVRWRPSDVKLTARQAITDEIVRHLKLKVGQYGGYKGTDFTVSPAWEFF